MNREDLRFEVRAGLVVVGCSLLAAVPLGVIWWLLAPLPHLVKQADGIFLTGGQGEVAVAADGWFASCAGTAGLIAALVVFARMPRGRLGPLFGLALGGLAGATIAWRLGVLLGPDDFHDTAKALADGTRFDAQLKLSARGVLFAWPLAATVAYFALTAGLEPRGKAAEDGGRRFPVTVLRPGYAIGEVDDAFARFESGSLAADELSGLHFSSSRWRQGYDSTSVDAEVAVARHRQPTAEVSPPAEPVSPHDGSAPPPPG